MSARCPTIPLLLQSSIYCAILEQPYIWTTVDDHDDDDYSVQFARSLLHSITFGVSLINMHCSGTHKQRAFVLLLQFLGFIFITSRRANRKSIQRNTFERLLPRVLEPSLNEKPTIICWSQSYPKKSQDILYSLQFHPLCRDHSHHIVIIQ